MNERSQSLLIAIFAWLKYTMSSPSTRFCITSNGRASRGDPTSSRAGKAPLFSRQSLKAVSVAASLVDDKGGRNDVAT
jgi:hypothetical protein